MQPVRENLVHANYRNQRHGGMACAGAPAPSAGAHRNSSSTTSLGPERSRGPGTYVVIYGPVPAQVDRVHPDKALPQPCCPLVRSWHVPLPLPLALVCSLAGMSVAPPPEVGSVARSGQRVQAWRAGRLRKRHDVAGQCGCPVAGGAPVTSPNSPQPVQRSLALEAPCAHTRPGPAPSARACLITACYAVP